MNPNSNKLVGNFENVMSLDDSGLMEGILKEAVTHHASKCYLRFLVSIFAQRTSSFLF